MIRALAGRGASSLAGQASAVQEYGHSALRRAWGCRQSWRTFSTSEEGASGSADIDQAQRPSPPTKDEKNLLNGVHSSVLITTDFIAVASHWVRTAS